LTLTAALHREEDWYIAQCLEVDVASQGRTIDEALANLAEAVELYLEEVEDPAGQEPVSIVFVVRRQTPGQPTTVRLVVADGCGEWSTFVGGGSSAF